MADLGPPIGADDTDIGRPVEFDLDTGRPIDHEEGLLRAPEEESVTDVLNHAKSGPGPGPPAPEALDLIAEA
jgi:hypothetical protein